MSEELINRVESILNKVDLPDRHTFFQLEKFVIGKEPTAQSQLWQIVREMQARMETIDTFRHQLEQAEDSLEIFDIKIERENRLLRRHSSSEGEDLDLFLRELEINIRKLQREKEALILSSRKATRKLKFVLEELAFLDESYHKIVNKCGEVKPMDDEAAQNEMWSEKLLEDFNLRVILGRPLETEFVKTVMCLPDDSPVKKHVVKMLEVIQARMLMQNKKPEIDTKAKITG